MKHIPYRQRIILAVVVAVATTVLVIFFSTEKDRSMPQVDGQNMMETIKQQLDFGPRYLNAPGHRKMQRFLTEEMQKYTDETVNQAWQYTGTDDKEYELANIVGRINPYIKKRIILATHYDSKKSADRDPQHSDQPVPGANDSASGVAVLVELAQRLHEKSADIGIDFVFFDGEEGDILQKNDYSSWKPLGSTYFAEHLDELYKETKPVSALVLDMVCDKHLNIYKERSSVQHAPDQVGSFWNIAREVDDRAFSEQMGQRIKDDHTPLNQAGIPSFLVIDFDYPPFHTTEDTLDKCSAESLESVAGAVFEYIYTIR